MVKSKFFRIGVEGGTTDGRTIQAEWLRQAAKNFDKTKYGARVNCEHIVGLSPNSDFGALGDIDELKIDTVKIDDEDRVALLASIIPNEDLITMNRRGKKVYSSMELDTDFSGGDEAYLVGLAMTDRPASLGTEMMKFAAGAKSEDNPFTELKQKPTNLFSAAIEANLEFNEEAEEETLTDKVKALFSHNKKAKKDNSDQNQAIETIAEEVTKLSTKITALSEAGNSDAEVTKLQETVDGFSTDLTALKKSLEKIPNFSHRPAATGGDSGTEQETDC